MRRIAAVSLLLSLLLSAVNLGFAQSRPRRVGNTTSTPQQQPSTPGTTQTQTTTSGRRPPVLTGQTSGNNPSSTQQQPTPASNEPEEVGEGDIVRVNTSLVTVPVSVMDRSGRYVPDLQQRDFRIFEDGIEQQVAYFASVEKPFTVALVIDTSSSTHFRMEQIQDAALAFVDQLRPEDQVIVVSFDDDVRVLSEATSDRYALRNAIRRTRNGGSTRLYDAVDFVINQRLNRVSGRKAVVLFTDGVDTTSKRATYQSNVRDAEELDALIYPVQYDTYNDVNAGGGGGGGGTNWPGRSPMPRRRSSSILIDILGGVLGGPVVIGSGGGGGSGGAGTSRSDYERANNYLNDLADKTGARLYRADTQYNLTQSFALIAEELRRQYSLGYYPKNMAQAGQRRQIKVRVMRPNLAVRARDSYISNPSNGSTVATQTPAPPQQPSPPEMRKRQLN
ncbi:MAG TPA: VWA domain-containing protein [Pyrinomonadaceae bacterium]|jgi:VWFA-related protein